MSAARSPHRILRPRLALLLVAAGLVGCAHTADLGRGHLLRIAVTEWRMNPDRIRVRPGELTILVRNVGRLTHNLVVARDEQPQAHTTPIPPGARRQMTVILTPGTYTLNSSLFSDRALGLYGTLIVSG